MFIDEAKITVKAGNGGEQHGWLVVEYMPRDGGHLPEPSVGDSVRLIGAWVDDTQHSWNEIHPVWAASVNGGSWHTSGPRFGGDAARYRSYNAAGGCRTASGNRCTEAAIAGSALSSPTSRCQSAAGSGA